MAQITIEEVRQFLKSIQGREITLDKIRSEFEILPGTQSFGYVRKIMLDLTLQKVVKPSGKRDGNYKVLRDVHSIPVFGQDHNLEVFDLRFPKDYDTGMEFGFSEDVIVRAGDLILIAGVSNFGKTTLAMNFLAENIEAHPVLMGNEYTNPEGQLMPRFVNRLESIDWVEWVNGTGDDKFTLLPVYEDFPEYIVKDRINIIDWINIETGEHYMIGTILNEIKRAVGKGVAIVVIQKSEASESGRGGQFTKDYTDVELLLDPLGEHEVRLTIGKVKESHKRVTGRSWAYEIGQGVKLLHTREVKKCPHCYGKGYTNKGQCDDCLGKKFIDR